MNPNEIRSLLVNLPPGGMNLNTIRDRPEAFDMPVPTMIVTMNAKGESRAVLIAPSPAAPPPPAPHHVGAPPSSPQTPRHAAVVEGRFVR